MRKLDSHQADFSDQLASLLARETDTGASIQNLVADILEKVRCEGDKAVCDYTQKFDHWDMNSDNIEISRERVHQAWKSVSNEDRAALELAANRIRTFHERQKPESWEYEDESGMVLGQRILALDSVGLYVPGGKAAYPSSVLMNAIPAHVAGVEKIIMVVPTPNGELNELVLAAAHIANVTRVFAVGGAQAIAALAYGTESIPKVDKVVGPGNKFVAAAKRQVFGTCGIDMIAGPSEIVVMADSGEPTWLAADFLSQAEHDEAAQSIFISTDQQLINDVEAAIHEHLKTLPRSEICKASLQNHGAMIHVHDLSEAADIINTIAPEHLELAMDDPDLLLPFIKHAGAIFLGHHVAEALGDYVAGPNHVLPTNGTARFSSPLSVDDFVKKSSILRGSAQALRNLGSAAIHLAHREGLSAHALSIEVRLKDIESS
ncbi:MAG: histidinol dehydrogenase [Mariprofundaceae bacterium]|nr:histidinol dehydrogenase [Mariprofundaceae bacterium]